MKKEPMYLDLQTVVAEALLKADASVIAEFCRCPIESIIKARGGQLDR